MEVYIVYKEYRNWEDADSNGADIIDIYIDKEKAKNAVNEIMLQEEDFFKENDIEILNKYDKIIETPIGDIEVYLVTKELNLEKLKEEMKEKTDKMITAYQCNAKDIKRARANDDFEDYHYCKGYSTAMEYCLSLFNIYINK